MKAGNTGFTLVEMMVVIGVMTVLLAILLLRRPESPPRTACASNLRQVGIAAAISAVDGGAKKKLKGGTGLAAASSLYGQRVKYVEDPRIFSCPSADDDSSGLVPGNTLNAFTGAPNPPDSAYGFDFDHTMFDPHDVAIGADFTGAGEHLNSTNHGRGRPGQNVLYIDGHTRWHTIRACGHGGNNIFKEDTGVDHDSYLQQ
jgi:prepilin-type N-terminal cleavage/methylation domain-containing protein